jgi:zinc/manganese transport system permease protein
MIHAIIDPFVDFAFMRRALVGCFALSLGAPPVGVFLVLRRLSLMGDAMSHAILPGAAIGFLVAGLSVTAMSLGGFIAGIAVVLLAGVVTRSTMLREDASGPAIILTAGAGLPHLRAHRRARRPLMAAHAAQTSGSLKGVPP